MPYANNNGVKIYYEVEGEGPPLLFHHGIGTFLEGWRVMGYVDALKNNYHLILIDARGHGKSDKPHDPEAYTMEKRVGDIVAVLDHTSIDHAHFFGYSYGCRAGFELAKLNPQRVVSMILGGHGAGPKNPNDPTILQQIRGLESGQKALEPIAKAFEIIGHPELKDGVMANDPLALQALLKAPWPDIRSDLVSMKMPFLIFAGESDSYFPATVEAAKLLTSVTFIPFPGLDHLQAVSRSDLVLPHIKEFLAQVSKK
jgi:pimeloyl-ACP methyl ester carboxylesterase